MEMSQSIQQTTYDQYNKLIKDNAANKSVIAKTILEILENQTLNTFSEFLHLKEVDELKVGEYERYYNTLNLFAFGTYRQFLENKEKIIPLTPVMDKKLKHLTILTLATQKKTLPYDDLMVELEIKNVRHLEDIIIEAIYAELINGKLDQKNRQLEIDHAVARDIQTENITEIVTILSEWMKSCESCIGCLQEQIDTSNAEKAKRMKHKERLEEQLSEVKKNIKKQSTAPQQNFDDQDGDFTMGQEKNLNTKEKRQRPKQGTSKGSTWFKSFNN